MSIFTRLIFTFLFIFLPIYLLGVGIHKWGVSIVRTEIINSMRAQMDYFKTVLQNELIRIQNLQNECLNDQDLLDLANIPQALNDFEKAQSINRLQSRLYTLKNSSIYIEEVKVILPVLDRSLCADKGINIILNKDLEIIQSCSGGSISKLVSDNNELYSRVRNVSFDTRKSNPNFVLQVKFSSKMLINTFASFNIVTGSGFLIFYPDQDYVLSNAENNYITDYIKSNIVKNAEIYINYMESVKIQNKRYFTFYQKLNYNDIWLVSYVPEEQVFSPLNNYMYILWILTALSIIIIIYFSISTHNFVQRPLRKLVSAFKRVEAGEMKFSIQHNSNDEFQYLYTRFNAMLDNVNYLIDQVYNQKIMSQKAELKQLQSQINPHFLFNSFFIMQRMIQADEKENAVKFCGYLGKYFRYVTRNAQDEIPLCKEVEHARNYLEIQSIRFSNMSFIFEELPQKYRNLIVPRLILQPVIENAFEYGLGKNIKQAMIAVRFAESDEGLYCSIEDSGDNIDDEELQRISRILAADDDIGGECTGLVNINRRIRLIFGNRSGVQVSRSDMGGWKVTIFFESKEARNVQTINCR